MSKFIRKRFQLSSRHGSFFEYNFFLSNFHYKTTNFIALGTFAVCSLSVRRQTIVNLTASAALRRKKEINLLSRFNRVGLEVLGYFFSSLFLFSFSLCESVGIVAR